MPETTLPAGTLAPDFTLSSGPEESVSLSDFRGQPVILAFYPADWSPVCSDELTLLQELLPEFEKLDAELLGISVDSVWSHQAFEKDRHLSFPLLADFEPKGKVSRGYGAYLKNSGESSRSLFVIDPEGVIRWSYRSPRDENPGAAGILKALEELQPAGAA